MNGVEDDHLSILRNFGFEESSAETLRRENKILQEGEIYVKTLNDGRAKIFLSIRGGTFSKKIPQKEIKKECKSIKQKLLKRIPILEETG